jgi:Kdo2-lipid IVA lauroyltransferase/acyltransferase
MEKINLTFWKLIRYGLEAAGFFLLMGFFKLLGLDAASAAGGFIGRHIFILLPPVKIARENLRAAYPEMSAAEIEEIVLAHCDNLGRVVAEYPHLEKLLIGQRIEVVGTAYGNAAIASGKGVMFVSGHFGNWEAMTSSGQQLGYDGSIVYRPPNNPFVAHWIERQRAKIGSMVQISKGPQGTRKIFTTLRRGKTVFLLVDQKTGQGVPAPFFGRDAMTTHAPAVLALKLGSILLPVACERTQGARFRVRIYPPVEFSPGGDHDQDVLALTTKINLAVETMVRANPSQWLWIHRRWPSEHDKKRIEKKR